MLIGLGGNLGCGKNYIAEKIISKYIINSLVIGFGDHVKVEASRLFGFSFHELFVEKNKNSRKKLQTFATEENREILGQDTWINALKVWMDIFETRGINNFIIPDVRFENEATFIKNQGGLLIKVVAPDRTWEKALQETKGNKEEAEKILSHSSEKGIPDEYYDFVLDNTKSNEKNIESIIRKILNI
jgi:dephospho-CoA kinase